MADKPTRESMSLEHPQKTSQRHQKKRYPQDIFKGCLWKINQKMSQRHPSFDIERASFKK